MKKTSIVSVVVIILVLVAGYFLLCGTGRVSPSGGNATTTGTITVNKSTTYFCAEGSFAATFGASRVILSLSNGQVLILPQTMSGSGARYEGNGVVFWDKGGSAFVTQNGVSTFTKCVAGTRVGSPAAGYTFTDDAGTFSFSYPSFATFFGNDSGYTSLWSSQTDAPGFLVAVVTLLGSYMPKTNFSDARFTIGTSASTGAIRDCETTVPGDSVTLSSTTINGVHFTKLTSTDVGAGNYYETTSYRTIRDSQCYAVEYTIHSANILNYPTDSGIKAFDKAKIQTILEGVARSFKFLN